MTLALHVDAARWRTHLQTTAEAMPGLVPVVKGNGYGFGLSRLAAEAQRLGAAAVAVGEHVEVAAVRAAFAGDVLVLAPWRPDLDDAAAPDERVVRTVAHLDALAALADNGDRIVVECLTSMHRHGVDAAELDRVVALLPGIRCEGFALHLPIDRPRGAGDDVSEVGEWLQRLRVAGLPATTLWLSHVTRAELAELRRRHPQVAFRARVGTALWLGDPAAFAARARVLDVRAVRAGERYGYRQRRARRPGTLLVVAGGTTHGVGLEAPNPVRGPVQRLKVLAVAALAAGGHNLSPFFVAGRKRWFAEPPHMQVSLVLLPAGVTPPRIGDELSLDVRMTTVRFDRLDGLSATDG